MLHVTCTSYSEIHVWTLWRHAKSMFMFTSRDTCVCFNHVATVFQWLGGACELGMLMTDVPIFFSLSEKFWCPITSSLNRPVQSLSCEWEHTLTKFVTKMFYIKMSKVLYDFPFFWRLLAGRTLKYMHRIEVSLFFKAECGVYFRKVKDTKTMTSLMRWETGTSKREINSRV